MKSSGVIGPVTGGIILAFEVARAIWVASAVYAERGDDGNGFVLRRGFTLAPGERVLIVEDIVTTGGSAIKVIATARSFGADVAGVGLLCDRSGGKVDFGVPIRSKHFLNLDIASYSDPEDIPDRLDGENTAQPSSPESTAAPALNRAAAIPAEAVKASQKNIPLMAAL